MASRRSGRWWMVLSIVLLAGLWTFSGCGDASSSPAGTVTGRLVAVGGGGPSVSLPDHLEAGVITATSTTGAPTVTAQAGRDGRFSMRLLPGRYRLSGQTAGATRMGGTSSCHAPRSVAIEASGTVQVDVRCQRF